MTDAAPPAQRLRLVVGYDGTDFAGWQVQQGARTVQGALEEAFASIAAAPARVTGSGRTDAGVHALAQVAHVDDVRGLPPVQWLGALNARLPADVRVRAVTAAAPDFHALHTAVGKTYVYQLHLSDVPGGQGAVEASVPPWRRHAFWAVRDTIDVDAMRRAARHLVGTHDFTALSKVMEAGRTTTKTLRSVRVLRVPRGLRIVVHGDGFLYGMVRLIAGLLVDVGFGRVDPDEVPERLAAGRRDRRSPSAPARGLFLWRVHYPAPHGTWRPALGPLFGAAPPIDAARASRPCYPWVVDDRPGGA